MSILYMAFAIHSFVFTHNYALGQARTRFEMIDFRNVPRSSAIKATLPDRVAVSLTLVASAL